MKEKIFEGAATALYTPFSSDGIDYDALGELIERQIAGKIDAVVILGTTGEAPTVTDKERAEIIKFTVSRVRNRIPVIVGCGSNCTKKFIDYTSLAKDCGADAALGVTPYYNKCSDEGLFRHFREADKACRFLRFKQFFCPRNAGKNEENAHGNLPGFQRRARIIDGEKHPRQRCLAGVWSVFAQRTTLKDFTLLHAE